MTPQSADDVDCCNRNKWEHDEEMMKLYEEMEQHINCEKQRIEEQACRFH